MCTEVCSGTNTSVPGTQLAAAARAFLAGAFFFAGAFLAGAFFFAGAFLAGAFFFAGAFLAGAFFFAAAAFFFAGAFFFAVPAARRDGGVTGAGVLPSRIGSGSRSSTMRNGLAQRDPPDVVDPPYLIDVRSGAEPIPVR